MSRKLSHPSIRDAQPRRRKSARTNPAWGDRLPGLRQKKSKRERNGMRSPVRRNPLSTSNPAASRLSPVWGRTASSRKTETFTGSIPEYRSSARTRDMPASRPPTTSSRRSTTRTEPSEPDGSPPALAFRRCSNQYVPCSFGGTSSALAARPILRSRSSISPGSRILSFSRNHSRSRKSPSRMQCFMTGSLSSTRPCWQKRDPGKNCALVKKNMNR